MVPWTMTKSTTNLRAPIRAISSLRRRQPEPARAGREIERVAAMGFGAWASTPDGCAARLYHDDPVFDPIYVKCQELGMIVS